MAISTLRIAPSSQRPRRRAGASTSGSRRSTVQSELGSDLPHGRDYKGDVLVEIHPQRLGAVDDVVPAHLPGESLVLHSLADGASFQTVERLVGTHQRGSGYEPRQLVDGEERLVHEADPGHAVLVVMTADGVDDGVGVFLVL